MKTNQAGFTLLEVVVAAGILVILGWVTFIALTSSVTSAEVASSKSLVIQDVRDLITSMSQELATASKRTDDSLNPRLDAIAVVPNPAAGSPVEVVFQVPTDMSGRNWSRPIRYRFLNEDANGNNLLDSGEDVDGDRVLTRRIVRIQDLDGDGSTTGAGETRILGSANNIGDIQFAIAGDILTITVTATDLVGKSRVNPVRTTVSTNVHLLN